MDKNGSRRNFTNFKPSPENNQTSKFQIEGLNLNNWNAETLSKILYSLLQHVELFKYLTQEAPANLDMSYF